LPPWVALVLASPLSAQTFADADSLLARSDTSGAIAVYEAMVRRSVRDAEAHYRAGVLYMTRHTPGTDLSPNRRKAEEHFRYASRFAPDTARYALALSDLFRTEDWTMTRMQVRGLVNRAREAAEASGDTASVANATYRQARADMDRYGWMGRRMRASEAGRSLVYPEADEGASWNEIEQFFAERVVPVSDGGMDLLAAIEENLWTTLSLEPVRSEAAGLLVVTMGEANRWEEAAAFTRRLIRQAPDSGWAWALHGLAMARTHRWREAHAAFDSAFAHLTGDEQAPFHNLGAIMREADRIAYEQMGEPARARLDSLYWRVAQPLTLTETNEVQAEFYARIVYAQHRWTDPWRGYRGIETDQGTVFVAYGPPDEWHAGAWLYRAARLLIQFSVTPGYSRARFAGTSRESFRRARTWSPARFDNIPLMRTLDTILVQTARFRGTGDSSAVVVMGAIPVRRMANAVAVRDLPLTSGAVVTDAVGRELQRDRRDETVTGTEARELQYRSWRVTLRPGEYLLRVEAHLPTLERGARSAQPFTVTRPPTGLALSDLLVAAHVTPRDTAAIRWHDYLIEPNAGRFELGAPVGLLWEIYNLTPDTAGITRYRVALWITVEAIDRSKAGLLAFIVGGLADNLGLTAVRDDQVTIAYGLERPATPDGARAEHLMVDLKHAPAGRYGIEVIVLDLVTGRQASTTRTITIGQEPVRRGARP